MDWGKPSKFQKLGKWLHNSRISDNKLVAYIVNELPKTELGKAMSTSVSSSVIFLFYVVALEKQYGTVKQMLRGGIVLLNTAAPLIIMVLGIGMLIKIILK